MLEKIILFIFLLLFGNACETTKHEELYDWGNSKIYCAYTDRGNSLQKIPAIAISVLLPEKIEITEAEFSLEDSLQQIKLSLQIYHCTTVRKNLRNCGLSLKMETAQKFIEFNPKNTCGYSELEKICNKYKLILEFNGVRREIQKGNGYKNIDGRILE